MVGTLVRLKRYVINPDAHVNNLKNPHTNGIFFTGFSYWVFGTKKKNPVRNPVKIPVRAFWTKNPVRKKTQ